MESKRKTLGGLTLNQLNSRASLAPARLGKDGKLVKLSIGGRPSMAGAKGSTHPGTSSGRLANPTALGPRRSSTYGKSTTALKTDPRPVNDKGFQGNCVRCLIAYLSTHGFDQPISPKMLASPMSKDFTSIVQFLMRQVDPNCNPKLFGKIEDDVPAFFKRMRYPFQISKSSLFAVGSPHTWPSLLASLVWITELLSYAEKADLTPLDIEDEKQRADAEFYEYISQSYRYFLAGDDDECERIDSTKATEFEERAAEAENCNKQLQEESDMLRARIAKIKENPSPLTLAKTKQAELVSDREKFKKVIDSLQSQKRSLQSKLQERQAEVRSVTEQLTQQEEECEGLEKRIAAQAFNCEDVSRMNSEKIKQEDILQSAEASRDSLQARVRDQEVCLEQSLDALDANLQEYNTIADRLQLIPRTAKRAGGIQFEAKLNRAGSSPLELINVDLKGGVKAAMIRSREACFSKQRVLAEETLVLQERLDSLSHSLTEQTEENATLTTQVHKAEVQLTQYKEEHELEVRAIQAQVEQIREEVAELKNATVHSIAHSSDRVHKLQSQYEEKAQECEIERNIFNQEIAAALHTIFEHKEYISKAIRDVHAHVSEATTSAMALVL